MGRIAPNMRADLSFWDKDYAIVATMVGGRFVYDRTEVAAVRASTLHVTERSHRLASLAQRRRRAAVEGRRTSGEHAGCGRLRA